MYLDVFTLSALVDEFMDTFVGGRVQDTIDVDETSIGLEIYADRRRHYLYLSADNHVPRVHLVPDKLRRGLPRPKQIGLLFRRYVESGTIMHVSQPEWERVLQFDVDGPEGEVNIVIEPMERRSNLLLLRDGVIMDCVRRVGPEDNRYRLSLPAHEYVPPPPQTGKRSPLDAGLEDIVAYFDQVMDPKRKAFQVLTSHLLGMSPLLAREIVFRAGGEADQRAQDVDASAVYDALQAVVKPLGKRQWQPGIAENDNGVEAFSVYPLDYLPGWHPVETVSEAMAAYYGAPVGEDAYNRAKIPSRNAIKEARAKLRAKLASLERSLTDDAERERLRQSGELILAYQYAMEPGQTELKAQYEADGPELVIQLDPKLSPLDNAQRYFSRYNKAKRAVDGVPDLIEDTRNELAYLDQLESDLELASNWPDIDEVQQALQVRGYWEGRPTRRIGSGQSTPIKVVTDDGYVIWVGRNSRQNEIVTFKKGGKEDFWLHAREVPGAHVVVKFDGRRVPEEVIEQAASLAAYYSARRADGSVPVDVTRCKYVRRIKGAAQGMVTYRNEETRMAVPRKEGEFA